jgi:hypothetical protein
MKVLGNIVKVIGYIQGAISLFFFGIIPAIGGKWAWGDFGLPLVLGIAGCIIFVNLGEWIKHRASIAQEGN